MTNLIDVSVTYYKIAVVNILRAQVDDGYFHTTFHSGKSINITHCRVAGTVMKIEGSTFYLDDGSGMLPVINNTLHEVSVGEYVEVFGVLNHANPITLTLQCLTHFSEPISEIQRLLELSLINKE